MVIEIEAHSIVKHGRDIRRIRAYIKLFPQELDGKWFTCAAGRDSESL